MNGIMIDGHPENEFYEIAVAYFQEEAKMMGALGRDMEAFAKAKKEADDLHEMLLELLPRLPAQLGTVINSDGREG